MMNSDKSICTTEYLALQSKYRISRCRYNRFRMCSVYTKKEKNVLENECCSYPVSAVCGT
jgi:hypothetical protein